MKRFAESDRFADRWYSRLSPDVKIIFEYLCASCDHGGVWQVNFELATFQIGFHRVNREINWDAVLDELNAGKRPPGAVMRVGGGELWWIVGFVAFQYGPNKIKKLQHIPTHIPIFRSLVRAGVWTTFCDLYPDMVPKEFIDNPPTGIDMPMNAVQEPPTLDELRAWPEAKGLPETELMHFHSYWSSRGWKRGREKLHDIRSTVTEWRINWIKAEDKKLTPTDLMKKIEAIDKEIVKQGQRTRLKKGTSISEPDPEGMENVRELRQLRKRYEEQLHGWTKGNQPAAPKSIGGSAAPQAEDPPNPA